MMLPGPHCWEWVRHRSEGTLANMHPPRRATPQSAGHDLCSANASPVEIAPQTSVLLPTGWGWKPYVDYYPIAGLIRARSGLALNHGVEAFGGTIDGDYPGEIFVQLTNRSETPYFVNPGDRIAQLVAVAYLFNYQEPTQLAAREGGFGSTGQ